MTAEGMKDEGELFSLLQELGCEDDQIQQQKRIEQKESTQLVYKYFAPSNSIESLSSNDPNKFRRLKGRSRVVNVKKINELRVVKRDIRRRYIEMYNNVINIHDHSLLSRFLTDICTPTCSYIIRLPGNHPTQTVIGIKEILHYTMEVQMKIPDAVECLTDGKIHVSLGKPGSRIISSASFRGTILYKFQTQMALDKSPQSPSLNGSSRSLDRNSSSSKRKREKSFKKKERGKKRGFKNQSTLIPPLELESKPTEIATYGILTMILDDMNRIESFIMEINDIHEREINIS